MTFGNISKVRVEGKNRILNGCVVSRTGVSHQLQDGVGNLQRSVSNSAWNGLRSYINGRHRLSIERQDMEFEVERR